MVDDNRTNVQIILLKIYSPYIMSVCSLELRLSSEAHFKVNIY